MHSYDTPGSVSLQIKLPNGRVVVTTVDQPKTTVDLVSLGRRGRDPSEDIEVTMDEQGGRHVLRVEQRNNFKWGPIQISWGADFECRITCPPGTELDLSGASTDVRVEGDLGEVSARTASGDVRLQNVGGPLRVKTASGDVFVAAVAGEASIVTVSGDVSVERIDTTLTGRTVSGDVTVGTVAGELVLATTSGDVDVKAVVSGDVRVQTVSGDVRVGIARGTRVWVDAASVSGALESELGLQDADVEGDAAAGAVVPLHVKTVSGDVAVVRAAAAISA
jgi:Putative adhesin